jgi:excisionase family DNA binding protein
MFTHTKPRYTVTDMLALLGIGRSRLYADINDGKLLTYKIGKRRFAKPEALDSYVKECEGGPDNE